MRQLSLLKEWSPFALDFNSIQKTISASKTDYATHNLHDYPAKFIPQFPAIFIRHFTKEGQYVLDPMCGSGTTLIEAALQKRHFYGIDIDPVAVLISKVATTPFPVEGGVQKDLRERNRMLIEDLGKSLKKGMADTLHLPSEEEYPNVKLWFREDVFKELMLIKNVILSFCHNDESYKNLALLSLSKIVRAVSNADPRDIFPERDLGHPVRERKNTLKEFEVALDTVTAKVFKFSQRVEGRSMGNVMQGDARDVSLDKKADLVFTSPPYAYAVDYARVHQLSTLLFITSNKELREHRRQYIGTDRVSLNSQLNGYEGFEFVRKEIQRVYKQDRKCGVVLHKYFQDMFKVTKNIHKCLKRRGHLIYVVGSSTIKGIPFRTDEVLSNICKNLGFKIEKTLERPYYAYRLPRERNVQSNTIKQDVFIIARKP